MGCLYQPFHMGWGISEVNIKDIAKLSGTSVATVSRVLNNQNCVSKEVRKKVLKVIEETGYKPNVAGRDLRRQFSRRLLIMLPTIDNQFYSDIVLGFEEQARANDYEVLLAISHRKKEIEREYYSFVSTKQVDGVASFIPTISINEINKFAKSFPFVACCWRAVNDINASYVCIDNEKASYDMTNYLLSLGHKCIAVMNGNYPERIYEYEREQGYRRALQEAGIGFKSEYYLKCGYDWLSAYNACEKLLSLKKPPTAIFAMSDERAAGIIKYLNEHGYKPGEDIDVAGFDNVVMSRITTPQITTIEQPCRGIGREAFNLLKEQVEDMNSPCKGVILSHKIIIRGSTRQKPME